MTAPTVTRATLPLSEVFGPTWQGEGPHSGRPAAFIRLGHCNLSCHWCDTPYTWDRSRYDLNTQCPDTPWQDIVERAVNLRVGPGTSGIFVITGGEPLIWQRTTAYARLVRELSRVGEVHVETNGTIPPRYAESPLDEVVAHYTVSPKLTTNDPVGRRLKPRVIARYVDLVHHRRACFKFVCATPADVEDVAEFTEEHGIPRRAVWVMPEGTSADLVINTHRAIAPAALAAGLSTTTRLHTLLWQDQRGH